MGVGPCDPLYRAGIADWFEGADLLDCYAVALPPGRADMRIIAEAILGRPSWWAQWLLAVHDGFAGLAGLRTDGDVRRSMEEGRRVGFVPIRSASDDGIILGEDDSHLGFRVSLLREPRRMGPTGFT